ncbi:MAG: hypothetical protein JSW27_16740 [Phycisphaerales bacterium]|nr:MAG: hypothetical protein JSW27_16740 [Phycisphaerales bacterium]
MRLPHITVVTLGAILYLAVMAPLSRSQPPNRQLPREGLDPNTGKRATVQEWMERNRRERRQRLEKWKKEQLQQIKQQKAQMEADRPRAMDEAYRRAVGATPAQWRVVKPRLEAVRALQADAYARLWPAISSGGVGTSGFITDCGWNWNRPGNKRPGEALSSAETTCETLCEMLSDEQTPVEKIWAQVELLRRQRRLAAEQVPDAQAELRKVLTLRQEAAATAHAWLP